MLTVAGCSATGQRETAPKNVADAARIIVPETFFEPLTRAVIQAYLDSTFYVSDKYWWLDCPGLGAVIRGDGVLRKEEVASVVQCKKRDTHRQFVLEMDRATDLGGYHFGRPVWNDLEPALSQYDNLEQFFARTGKYYWKCEAVDIPADGVISGFRGKRTVLHTPSPPANSGELYDCSFPFYTQRPIYMRMVMIRDLASLLNLHDVTQPTLFTWTVRVYSPDKQSPLTLVDSSAMGRNPSIE